MVRKAVLLVFLFTMISPMAGSEEADPECWPIDNHVWWSPDGSRLVLYSSCNDFDRAQIVTINPDGTDARNVSNNQGSNYSPEWSPDGKKIAYYSNVHDPKADELNGPFDIYVMKSDGGDPIRLTTAPGRDGGPVWSPDGREIAFYSNRDGDTEIYVMSADGANQRRITRHKGWDWPMGWSRKDGRLLAAGMHDGNLDIYTLRPDGSDIRYLTDSPDDEEHPAYSPDGNHIIYKTTHGKRHFLVIMNADGSNKKVVAESDTHIFDQPAFSSDGRQIGYSVGNSYGPDVKRYWRTVVIADRDGSNPRILRGRIRD